METSGFVIKEFTADDNVPNSKIILAVAENYPLPGKSLDLEMQRQKLKIINEQTTGSIIYVGLKDPYDLNLIQTDVYASAIGSNISNIKAMVNLLLGKTEATGKLPVSPIQP